MENDKEIIALLSERHTLLIAVDSAIEAKAGILLAGNVAVAIFTLSNTHLFPDSSDITLIKLAFASLLVSSFFGVLVLMTRAYALGILTNEMVEKYRVKERQQFLEECISNYKSAISRNSESLKEKSKYYKYALNSFGLSVIILMLILI